MTLREQIEADLRDSLRAGDETRKQTLRLLLTAIRNAEIPARPAGMPDASLGQPSTETAAPAEAVLLNRPILEDAAVLDVIRKEVKQRRDSIDAYTKANRPDLVAREEAEAAVLAAYLPAQMSREEIAAVARRIFDQTGARGPADKGRVMPLIMAELRDRAEGREINAVVTALLAEL
jgi:uncharacterized protein YqeY